MKPEDEMSELTEWEALSRQVMQDRRKGKRVPLAFPIEVSGLDRSGRMFSEKTSTCDISEVGCRFLVKTQLERGDVVAIKLISRTNGHAPESKPLLFQIVWVNCEADGWAVGALQLQKENLWHVAFPPHPQPKTSSK